MATITSSGSGLWSAGATWVGGVAPVDNDAVVIASGHVVEFDVDQSGFANGIDGITVTGTLSLTRTTGTYYLKVKAATTIGGAGTFDCGTLASPIPFAAKHTITGGAGWYIKGNDGAGLTMTVYAAEPAIKTVLLTGAESAGATVLEVDTDITGDIWADGDTIRIDNVNKGRDTEERVIAVGGRAVGAITITAGLTRAKIAGTLVHLMTRNVKFIGGASGTYIGLYFLTGKLVIGGGWHSCSGGELFRGAGISISGGAFSGSNTFLISSANCTMTGGVISGCSQPLYSTESIDVTNASFSGYSVAIQNSNGYRFSNALLRGGDSGVTGGVGGVLSGCTIQGNNIGITGAIGLLAVGGVISNNNGGIANSAATLKNVSLTSNASYDIRASVVIAYNTLVGSSTENYNYATLPKEIYSESIDHDQVAGAYKAWNKGGVTTKQAVTYPTGYTKAMQTVLENASVEGYWQKEVTVGAGASISFDLWLRKSASMTYLPRCLIFNKASTDPFAGGTALKTFTMTNSVDTWENDTYVYTNTTTEDITLVVRFQGMNATGNMFSALTATQINVDLTSALVLLNAVKAKTDNLPSDPADESLLEAAIAAIPAAPSAATIRQEIDNNSTQLAAILVDTGTDIPAAIAALPESVLEGTITIEQALRLMLAALAGKASGGGTTAITFRDTADSKDRIVATVDGNGNRTGVVLDVT